MTFAREAGAASSGINAVFNVADDVYFDDAESNPNFDGTMKRLQSSYYAMNELGWDDNHTTTWESAKNEVETRRAAASASLASCYAHLSSLYARIELLKNKIAVIKNGISNCDGVSLVNYGGVSYVRYKVITFDDAANSGAGAWVCADDDVRYDYT